MSHPKLKALGLDLSTQSLTAVVMDIASGDQEIELSLNYLKDCRLAPFGQREPDFILPPRIEGEADQPPDLFLAALDAIFEDLKREIDLSLIGVINVSGQQHGHVYLSQAAPGLFKKLNQEGSEKQTLTQLLTGSLAYERAPIWMTSCTQDQTETLTERIGGADRLIQITGSAAQKRFTGVVVGNVAKRFPEIYEKTALIHLLSSYIPAVLAGKCQIPTDFGNASGMHLMNYRSKTWDHSAAKAIAEDLPGGPESLLSKLPPITQPDSAIGTIATYFITKYGLDANCLVAAGSGDNPQSKVLVSGDLLSLGSSIVFMVGTDGKTFDMTGAANAMYDGVGRPFMFGCRTNGALVWDQVRARHGLGKNDYETAEKASADQPIGKNVVMWQPRIESFPISPAFEIWTDSEESADLGTEFMGCVESSLAAVYQYSKPFARETSDPLFVTGSATKSKQISRRIAAIWKRPIISLEDTGAAKGAAVAGISAFHRHAKTHFDVKAFTSSLISMGPRTEVSEEDINAFHQPKGYLERFAEQYEKLISAC